MNRRTAHGSTALNVLRQRSHCADVEVPVEDDSIADVDEPPENPPTFSASDYFKRAPICRGSEHHDSLLTKALQSQSEDDAPEHSYSTKAIRRRSITSNFSLASSTADWTCDTGITTPARTSTPSPHLPDLGFVPLVANLKKTTLAASSPRHLPTEGTSATDAAVQALKNKRCISFACVAKPKLDPPSAMPPPPRPAKDAPPAAVVESTKRSNITFACPARTDRETSTAVKQGVASGSRTVGYVAKDGMQQKQRSPSAARPGRSLTPRPPTRSPSTARSRKYVRADSEDLRSQYSRFYEFASDEPLEDDWISRDDPSVKRKFTINDILEKENAIRKLGKEAEEEAELEDELEAGENDDDDMDGDDDVDESQGGSRNVVGYTDDHSAYGSVDNASDGYHSDNEHGFAESEDEDDDLVLWTMGQVHHVAMVGATPVRRGASNAVDHSDSSISCKISESIRARSRARKSRAVFRAQTPDLPDSTDFVCGTFDEDQPLEAAYMSRIAARKKEKHRPIPQDIDPSFPTSEPDDDDDNLLCKDDHDSMESDSQMFHGELEDLHHEQDRMGRKKTTSNQSPKRYRSPPPKRVHSPAPNQRGRSPIRLFDRRSPNQPCHALSLAPLAQSPPGSLVQAAGAHVFKPLAFRQGLTHTKSLPQTPAVGSQIQSRRSRANTVTKEQNHVRGAIDIVKGLEQKRQRRREKFYQKYAHRARKEKAQEKRPVRGHGAERMREIGLFMAGKIKQGNYVLSV